MSFMLLTSDRHFTVNENRAIISVACPECISLANEACCLVSDGYHHASRVAMWRSGRVLSSR